MPKKLDVRAMMGKAIEIMRHSVPEPRDDGKASPLVGAVLVTPEGTVDTAFRGELRQGDHAEFTLLERKHRDGRLDGSVLFATLEPCAPGARKHPKLSCAERIVNARINEVWVGIEDPDPTVDRQGIRYLEDNGVKVHLFDRDLQDEIRAANKKFIEQALERAATSKNAQTAKPVSLSRWDEAFSRTGLDDLSATALAKYRTSTNLAEKVGTQAFYERLVRQGLLVKHGKAIVPTGFGYLLFGAHPRERMHPAGLNATIEYPGGEHEIKDFDGPALLIPEQVEQWLRPKLPSIADRSQMQRKVTSFPFEFVREGLINALVHRDYDLTGATCQLHVNADTITIRSPGAPPPPVRLEQLQAFDAPMYNRNPKLQFAFGGTKLVEGRGLGMRTFGSATAKYSLPRPQYSFDGVYLNLTIYRHAQAAVRALPANLLQQLSKSELAGWEWLSSRETVTSPEYEDAQDVSNRTALNHLNHFTQLGLVDKTGAGPSTTYRVRGSMNAGEAGSRKKSRKVAGSKV